MLLSHVIEILHTRTLYRYLQRQQNLPRYLNNRTLRQEKNCCRDSTMCLWKFKRDTNFKTNFKIRFLWYLEHCARHRPHRWPLKTSWIFFWNVQSPPHMHTLYFFNSRRYVGGSSSPEISRVYSWNNSIHHHYKTRTRHSEQLRSYCFEVKRD